MNAHDEYNATTPVTDRTILVMVAVVVVVVVVAEK